MPWPTVNDTTNMGRILGVNTQVTETDLVFGQVTFNAYIFTSDSILVPLALIEDSYFNLDTYIAKALGMRLGPSAQPQDDGWRRRRNSAERHPDRGRSCRQYYAGRNWRRHLDDLHRPGGHVAPGRSRLPQLAFLQMDVPRFHAEGPSPA